jgi:hypothetical protein
MSNEWDFMEVVRRRRATEDDAMAREVGGGGWGPPKMLFYGWSLISYTGIKYENDTCV